MYFLCFTLKIILSKMRFPPWWTIKTYFILKCLKVPFSVVIKDTFPLFWTTFFLKHSARSVWTDLVFCNSDFLISLFCCCSGRTCVYWVLPSCQATGPWTRARCTTSSLALCSCSSLLSSATPQSPTSWWRAKMWPVSASSAAQTTDTPGVPSPTSLRGW